jgi:L-asparaginase/Glu-tRNA(Gln) amidotransferase subunit D
MMVMDERILVIRTGGTIDAVPYDDPRNPPDYVETLKRDDSLTIPTIKRLGNPTPIDEFTWGEWQENQFVKDSKLFTPQDMDALATIIKNDTHRTFIVTHGTDAMVKNATMLQERLANSGKVVVFVGAMIPLSMHDKHKSDAVDSLSFAINHITSQEPGVYIVGRDDHTRRLDFFNPCYVEKDRNTSITDGKFTLQPKGSQR